MTLRLGVGLVVRLASPALVNRERELMAIDWAARAREAVARVAARKS